VTWAPDYITDDELKDFVRIELADTVDDGLIPGYITAASRAVDEHCNRQFGQLAAPDTWSFDAWPNYERGVWVVDIADLMTAADTVVVSDGTVTTYRAEPRNAPAMGKPWTRLIIDPDTAEFAPGFDDLNVDITATWGWSAVPAPVKLATRLQASRFAARRDSPYGVAGSPDSGTEMRLLSKLDPDVAVSLRGLVRPRTVA